MQVLRPQSPVKLTFEPAPLHQLNDCLMPISVSTGTARDWLQPLQNCHNRRIPYSRNELAPTPQGFKRLAKKAFIPAVKKVVTL